jgi:hypothetical protein
MAEIYLFHPKHGVKIATMEMEAQYDESNGWTRFDPEDMVNSQPDDGMDDFAADLPDPELEVNVMSEAPRRRGRPRASKDE